MNLKLENAMDIKRYFNMYLGFTDGPAKAPGGEGWKECN